MPSDFRLPPVGFGPGSQPSAADGEELSYMAMPKDMAVYLPHTPEVDDPKAVGPALTLLRDIAAACATVAEKGGSQSSTCARSMPRTARLSPMRWARVRWPRASAASPPPPCRRPASPGSGC
jgi:hypothetical protein